MIQLIVFDMDGVLVDARELHYQALNEALKDFGWRPIDRDEQASVYEALPTREKLRIYSQRNGLPIELHAGISQRKQDITQGLIRQTLQDDPEKRQMIMRLRGEGYRVIVASNAIGKSVRLMLEATGLWSSVELALSNESVPYAKPNPAIYQAAMTWANVSPSETLIVEDSVVGRMAAVHSGAWLCEVVGPEDVTYDRVKRQIEAVQRPRMKNRRRLNVLIPMAGAGSRFAQAGYTFPKPLIEVHHGKPMIQAVVENLAAGDAQYTFVVQKEHYAKYQLKYMLNLLAPGCHIVQTEGVTQGAACTTLLAKQFIDNDQPLLIANSDQIVEWSPGDFYRDASSEFRDGSILTFRSTHPKWSYVKLGPEGYVTELAEKQPISNIATVGIYHWQRGSDYVRHAEAMIAADERVNGEFYVAPVYNRAIAAGSRIGTFDVRRMWGIGVPEDLAEYLQQGG